MLKTLISGFSALFLSRKRYLGVHFVHGAIYGASLGLWGELWGEFGAMGRVLWGEFEAKFHFLHFEVQIECGFERE